MRIHPFLSLAFLLGMLSCCARARADWVPLKSVEGQFSAAFPAAPKEVSQEVMAGPFTMTVHALSAPGDNECRFTLLWNDYPHEMMVASTPQRILEGIAKGYDVPDKKVLSDKILTIGGKLARELEVDVGLGEIHRVRLIISGDRLYQLMTYAPVASRDDPSLAKFLNGFSQWFVLDYPPRGFRIEGAEMAGWIQIGRDKGKTAVQWMSDDSKAADLRAFITVEAARGTNPSAEETAQSLAASWGGKLAKDKLLLDGEPAFKVEAANSTPTLKPIEGIVAVHQGLLYLIMGGAVSGRAVDEPMDQIVSGWKWEQVVAPSSHLGVLPSVEPVFGGLATISYPMDMYINRNDTPDRVLDLSLYDVRSGIGSFEVFIQLAPLAKGAEFAKTTEDFLARMNAQKVYDDELTWIQRKGDPLRLVTASSHSAAATAMTKHDTYVKWALIKLNDDHMILINFTIVPGDDREKALYEAAAERIVDSIHPRTPVTQPAKN